MIAVLLSLIFIFLSSYTAEAYTYSSYMEIESLPSNLEEENSICYDNEEVKDDGNILNIPPDTEVVFGVDGNFSNSVVDARIFLSKDNPYQGDLTKMFGISLPMGEFSFVKNGSTAWRYGRMYSLEDIALNAGRNNLLILKLIQPLKVVEYSNTVSDGVVNVKTVLKNDTDISLNNIVYTHGQISLTKDFNAGEEYTYEYTLEYDKEEQYIDLGYPSIYNPNIRTLCAAGANSAGNPYNIFLIEDGTVYHDEGIGSEEYEGFCITQIAYTLNLGGIEVGEKEESQADDNSNEEDIGKILGIDILPKTAVDMYGYIFLGVFLVAFGILCYYFTNENSIRNA
jgi:hypothetical protein